MPIIIGAAAGTTTDFGFISDERWHHGYGSYDGEANRYGGYGYGWRGHHGCCW